MKKIIILLLSIILAIESKSNIPRKLKDPDDPPGPPPSGGGDTSYDYTDYKATMTDQDLDESEYNSTTSDQIVAYV